MLALFLDSNPDLVRGRRVLELGAGTAVAAMAAVRLGAACVAVQELPEVMPHTKTVLSENGCLEAVECIEAKWGPDILASASRERPFDVVVMADVLYHCTDFADLIASVQNAMSDAPGSCVVVAFEQRRRNLDSFFEEMTGSYRTHRGAEGDSRAGFSVDKVLKHCAKNNISGAECSLYLVVFKRQHS
jgi:predicted nicotinamide N-methyase